ncbi:MAG: DUF3302 domain-containing protein [Candidatus Acidiferrum sp.]
MLGFQLTIWDYVTFAVLIVLGAAFLTALVFVLGLPGRIAIARNHPDAEAINVMGWVGFLAVVPWIQVFIWPFKPTTVIDIRRYPKVEDADINEEIAKLKGAVRPEQEAKPVEAQPKTLTASSGA